MKKIFLTLFILFISTHTYSQFSEISSALNKKVNGTIVLINGKKLHGSFRMPTIASKKIIFFNKKKGKSRINSNSIKHLISKGKKGRTSTLVYTKTARYTRKYKLKIYEKKVWLLIISSGKKAICYAAGTGFRIRKGVIEAIARGPKETAPSINYYGKIKRRDKIPIFLDIQMSGFMLFKNATFKRYGSYFFRGTPFASKIEKKEKGYKSKNLLKIFNEFNGNK